MKRNVLKRIVITVSLIHLITLIYYLCTSFMGYNMRNLIASYTGNKVSQPITMNSSIHPSSAQEESSNVSKSHPPINTLNKYPENILKLPTSTFRPDVCKGCFQNGFEILLENKNICKTNPDGETIDLIIIIFTHKKSMKRREAIRKTWTQHTKKNTANTRYVFAFGSYPTLKMNIELAKEATMYGDIVQAGFDESYYNLTYKTITMLGWVTKNCPNAKNVMKTDDDMWVNIPLIVKRFYEQPLSKTVAGYCIRNGLPIRSKESKWYASPKKYYRDKYPDFCSGTGYVMDTDTAINIHKFSVDVPFFYLEDIYVALCIEHLGNGYRMWHTSGFNELKYPKSDLCSFKRFVLTSHYMSPRDIEEIWDAKC